MKKINKKYPKAEYKCELWAHDNVKTSTIPPTMKEINNRELFDFFDEQKLFIRIDNGMDMGGNSIFDEWCYVVQSIYNDIWTDNKYYKTRKQAEQVAFERAFEILESKLKEVEVHN